MPEWTRQLPDETKRPVRQKLALSLLRTWLAAPDEHGLATPEAQYAAAAWVRDRVRTEAAKERLIRTIGHGSHRHLQPGCLDTLAELAADESPAVRRRALAELGAVIAFPRQQERAVPQASRARWIAAVAAALEDPEAAVREQAVFTAHRQLAATELMAAIGERVVDTDPGVRMQLAALLPAAALPRDRLLCDPDPGVRFLARSRCGALEAQDEDEPIYGEERARICPSCGGWLTAEQLRDVRCSTCAHRLPWVNFGQRCHGCGTGLTRAMLVPAAGSTVYECRSCHERNPGPLVNAP